MAVDLPDEQRELLICGLREWGGPAYATDVLARAMGFIGVEALYREGARLQARCVSVKR